MTNKIEDFIKLADGATKGPWWVNRKHFGREIRVEENRQHNGGLARPITRNVNTEDNADFIAASRTLAPALARALLEVEKELESVGICVDLETVHNSIDKALATIQKLKDGNDNTK